MKKFLTVLMAVLTVFALVGCSNNEPVEPAEKNPLDVNGDGQVMFGISMPKTDSDFCRTYSGNNIKYFTEELGVPEENIIVKGCNTDVNQQIADLENMAAAGCDGIIIIPEAATPLEDCIKKLVEQGLYVTTNATLEEVPSQTVGCLSAYYDLGHTIGDAAGKWLAEKGYNSADYVVCTSHYQLSKDELIGRYEGLKDGILEHCPDITIVDQASPDTESEIALFETQYTTYGDKMVAWVTLWNNIVWEQVKAYGLNNEDFGLFCGEQSQEMADQLADPENIAFKGFFCQHDAPTVYDADTLVTRELVKAMKGEPYQKPCMDNPGPYVTKENVYTVWPDTKKY